MVKTNDTVYEIIATHCKGGAGVSSQIKCRHVPVLTVIPMEWSSFSDNL